MKKMIAFSLALVFILSLAACSGGGETGGTQRVVTAPGTTACPVTSTAAPGSGEKLSFGGFSLTVPGSWENVDQSGGCTLTRAADGAKITVSSTEGNSASAVAADTILLYNFYKSQYVSRGIFREGKTSVAGNEALYYECFVSKELTKNTDVYGAFYFFVSGDSVFSVVVYSTAGDLSGNGEILGIINSIEINP